jgi:pimeloyl-ACP methyl ester carboxylesterase
VVADVDVDVNGDDGDVNGDVRVVGSATCTRTKVSTETNRRERRRPVHSRARRRRRCYTLAMAIAHEVLQAKDASPTRAMLFLHGILGRGNNWRSHARRFVDARPDWAAVLVDLRLHGDSLEVRPPHTLASCARDLRELPIALPIRVALAAELEGEREGDVLDELWVIDSTPSARPDRRGSEDVLKVIAMLKELPREHAERSDFVAAIRERGFSEMLARWLATSLVRRAGVEGWRYPVDLDAIEAMLDDYFARDLWDAVPHAARDTFFVIGGRSGVFDDTDRARAQELAARHEAVHLEVFESSGHWLHVEEPDRLSDRLAR